MSSFVEKSSPIVTNKIWRYNFKEMNLKSGSFENDLALLSQKDKVISSFSIHLEFEYEIEVKP